MNAIPGETFGLPSKLGIESIAVHLNLGVIDCQMMIDMQCQQRLQRIGNLSKEKDELDWE